MQSQEKTPILKGMTGRERRERERERENLPYTSRVCPQPSLGPFGNPLLEREIALLGAAELILWLRNLLYMC